MNLHYIEYMIRERRREEFEACERLHLLNSAGDSQAGLMRTACHSLVSIARRLIKQRSLDHQRLQPRCTMIRFFARRKGEGQ